MSDSGILGDICNWLASEGVPDADEADILELIPAWTLNSAFVPGPGPNSRLCPAALQMYVVGRKKDRGARQLEVYKINKATDDHEKKVQIVSQTLKQSLLHEKKQTQSTCLMKKQAGSTVSGCKEQSALGYRKESTNLDLGWVPKLAVSRLMKMTLRDLREQYCT